MNARFNTFPTRFGDFSLAVNEAGAVVASAFGPAAQLATRFRHHSLVADASLVREARAQVEAYCAGELHDFTLPLAASGTEFQHRVWAALRKIPFGTTQTYRELAAAVGNPAASRAVGRANATNPICLIVPCHRVIGSDGSLTGFAFGEALKRALLDHERALAARGVRAA